MKCSKIVTSCAFRSNEQPGAFGPPRSHFAGHLPTSGVKSQFGFEVGFQGYLCFEVDMFEFEHTYQANDFEARNIYYLGRWELFFI